MLCCVVLCCVVLCCVVLHCVASKDELSMISKIKSRAESGLKERRAQEVNDN